MKHTQPQLKGEIGMIGWGVMGRKLVLNMADHGFALAGYDLDPVKVGALRKAAAERNISSVGNLLDFIALLRKPRILMMRVPAGAPVDSVIKDLLPHLDPGDLIINAGNFYFKDTDVPGDRGADSVAQDSQTETFAALKQLIDNWRWQDVPFYLRTGKRLPRPASEISIQFRAVPHQSFPPEASLGWQPSRLIRAIQPDEGIVPGLQAKIPGAKMQLRPVDMRFNYHESSLQRSPDADETLLWDIMKCDATLFRRADPVEAAWQLLRPVLRGWQTAPPSDFPNYAAGRWGSEDVQGLLAHGHRWPLPTELAGHNEKRSPDSQLNLT